tara:strand:- start:115 stop:291 length:177 start_codon:yes stop_codon:yes gene_type:complete
MKELITIIGELSNRDLAHFLSNYDVIDIETMIDFLYNLSDDDVEEVMSEIGFNRIDNN